MKQIRLPNNELCGKTVKGVSFLNTTRYNKPHLCITFTDDTYIMITADYNSENDEIFLKNYFIPKLETFAYPPGTIDDKGFHYYEYIQRMINLGILEADEEREKEAIEHHNEMEKKRRYDTYLKLKEEFENE